MIISIPNGQFAAPLNWEVRSRVSFHAPVNEAPKDWADAHSTQSRENIVVSRRLVKDSQTPKKLLESILNELATNIRGMAISNSDELKFDDGNAGAMVDVTLPASPQVQALQRHAVRIDEGIATHLIVTVAEQSRREELGALLRTFRP